MSCSEDKESFISLKMNVLQNHLWLSQNENCEYCFYDTKIFLQNWNLGLCVMIFSVDSGKQQRICLKIVYIFTSLTSQLMPLTMPKTVRGFLHGAVFTRGFQFLTIGLTDLNTATHSAWCHQTVLHSARGIFYFEIRQTLIRTAMELPQRNLCT